MARGPSRGSAARPSRLARVECRGRLLRREGLGQHAVHAQLLELDYSRGVHNTPFSDAVLDATLAALAEL